MVKYNMDFWIQVKQNFLGNLFADLLTGVIFGSVAVFYITKYFQTNSEIKSNIGALTLISAELQINQHMLHNMLNEMIPAFEKTYRKGDSQENDVNQDIFEDAAKFMKIPADAILSKAFNATYVGLGNLRNKKLLERILNLYIVEFHYRIQTSFRMEQLNWKLLDSIKDKLKKVIEDTNLIRKNINTEIKSLNKINIYFETAKRLLKN